MRAFCAATSERKVPREKGPEQGRCRAGGGRRAGAPGPRHPQGAVRAVAQELQDRHRGGRDPRPADRPHGTVPEGSGPHRPRRRSGARGELVRADREGHLQLRPRRGGPRGDREDRPPPDRPHRHGNARLRLPDLRGSHRRRVRSLRAGRRRLLALPPQLPERYRGTARRGGRGGQHRDRRLPVDESRRHAGVQEDLVAASMNTWSRTTALFTLAALLCLAAPVLAARQTLALFPPEIHPADADNTLRSAIPVIEQTLKEKLGDRFDVRPAGEGGFPPAGGPAPGGGGDDPGEKARIPTAGPGLFHGDAADVNRNGVADIVAVRYTGGKALSDIWEFDGKEYRKISSGLPYFLRTADLGPEGIVLLAQASDPMKIYQGPVFRVGVNRGGQAEVKDRH